MIEADYFIYALIHARIKPALFYEIFDNDLDCLRFFTPLDAEIIDRLITAGRDDIPALLEAIGQRGQERLSEINARIASSSFSADPAQLVSWAARMQHEWQRREGLTSLEDAKNALESTETGAAEVLAEISVKTAQISAGVAQSRLAGVDEVAYEARDLLYSYLGLRREPWVPTNFPLTDEAQMPLVRNKTSIVAGRSGSGKTSLVQHWLDHSLDQGMVGIWFCELTRDDMVAREVLRNTRAGSFYKLRKMGRESAPAFVEASEEKRLIDEEVERLKARHVYYEPAWGLTKSRLLFICRMVAEKHGRLDFVAIDHIRLYRPAEQSESWKIPASYIEIVETLETHFPDTVRIVLQHLTKELARTYRVAGVKKIIPTQDDIPYNAADHVDMAFILIRDEQYRTALFGVNADEHLAALREKNIIEYKDFLTRAWLWPVKARAGVANKAIKYRFQGGYYSFEEAEGETE